MGHKKNSNNTYTGNLWLKSLEQVYDFNTSFSSFILYKNIPSVYELKINAENVYGIIIEGDKQYKVNINLKKFDVEIINKIKGYISSNFSLAFEINLGHFPESLIEKIQDLDINLLPCSQDDLSTSCTCIEKETPCSHLLAVYCALAEEISKNPYLLLALRGISTEELISATEFLDNSNKVNNKFIPYQDINLLDNQEDFSKDDFNFPVTDTESLFAIIPQNPLFYERSDFKSKLKDIYETVHNEIDSLLINEGLSPSRDTDFFLYYTKQNDLKAFITPSNNFLYYLKSKGSRARYTTERLQIPEINPDSQQLELKQREGICVSLDTICDYFLELPLNINDDRALLSSKFLSLTANLAIAIARSSSYIPEVVFRDKNVFTIRYIPLIENSKVKDALDFHKSVMPVNLIFKNNGLNVLSKECSLDALSIFLTHLIRKLTFLKSSKLKSSNITTIFTKDQTFKSVSSGKNIAKSIDFWLEMLSIKNKVFSPAIRIEKNPDDTFSLNIDILNKNDSINPFISLSKFINEEISDTIFPVEQVKIDIFKQIMIASLYIPALKEILDSKGVFSPTITLREITEIILKTSKMLDQLGIKLIIPKELKTLSSINISLKAAFKDNSDINYSALFNFENNSHLSLSKLLEFSYEIAIGDNVISKNEFIKLVNSADGIVKFKDQYLILNPDEASLILEKISNPVPEIGSALTLLHSTLSESYGDMTFNADEAIKRIAEDLLKPEEILIPISLNGKLRPYQERGYKWLYSNLAKGFGSCIADDMGLGKTIQVISLLLKLREDNKFNKPVLIICPTTLVGNWIKEFEKFAPSLNVSIYHGSNRDLTLDNKEIIVTTYGLLRLDFEYFKDIDWKMVIIDEAQNIKNPDAAQTIAVKSLKADNFIAMTGTPVENRLAELWSIFDYTNRGYLGSQSNFQKNYANPIEKLKDSEKVSKLKLATSPFVLRRLKTDKSIITDLPEKLVLDEYCYLTKEQAALYERILQNEMRIIEESHGIQRRGHIFKLITALKQICNHPAHYNKGSHISKELSGKTEKTISIIENILEQDEKAIIFTQYKEMGDILVRLFQQELGLTVPFFHGSLQRQKRDILIEDFQSKESIKLMVISLKAGGTGLNLTAATNVIHYDLWWNPAVEDQATDRVYRIGQTQNVNVHRLITLGTFEEKIDEMIKSKRELANLTVSTGEKWITELTNRDLKQIFSLSRI